MLYELFMRNYNLPFHRRHSTRTKHFIGVPNAYVVSYPDPKYVTAEGGHVTARFVLEGHVFALTVFVAYVVSCMSSITTPPFNILPLPWQVETVLNLLKGV